MAEISIFMKRLIALLFLLPLALASCEINRNISRDARFKNLVGRPIVTRVPLKLYEIDYQLNGLKDRYALGGEVGGQPLVGIVPTGYSVFFEKAMRRDIPDASFERLDGVVEFRGKSYLISYFLGLSGKSSSDFWKGLRYDFVIPDSPN